MKQQTVHRKGAAFRLSASVCPKPRVSSPQSASPAMPGRKSRARGRQALSPALTLPL